MPKMIKKWLCCEKEMLFCAEFVERKVIVGWFNFNYWWVFKYNTYILLPVSIVVLCHTFTYYYYFMLIVYDF